MSCQESLFTMIQQISLLDHSPVANTLVSAISSYSLCLDTFSHVSALKGQGLDQTGKSPMLF